MYNDSPDRETRSEKHTFLITMKCDIPMSNESFRLKPSEFKERLPHSGVYYLTSTAYFKSSVKKPWVLTKEIISHASKISGNIKGDLRINGSREERIERDGISTQEIVCDGEIDQEVGNSVITDSFFESGRHLADTRKVKEWRVRLFVSYAETQFMMNRLCDPEWPVFSLSCIIDNVLVSRHSRNDLATWLREFWSIVETSECVHGLTTFGSSDFEVGSRDFDTGSDGSVSWHTRLETWKWIFAGKHRTDRLRGVFWGTFISNKLALQLGDPKQFLKQYLAHVNRGWAPEPLGVITPGKGLWLQASGDPLDDAPSTITSEHDGIQNALWLESELRQKNLLW